MTDVATLEAIMDEGRYAIYGVRAHRSEYEIGGRLPNSYRWDDGECTGEELDGTCAIRVRDSADIEVAVSILRDGGYVFDGSPIMLVAGNSMSDGEDDGEAVIRNAVCLAVLA